MKTLFAILVVLLASAAAAAPSLDPGTCVQSQPDICVDATPCKDISGVRVCLSGAPSTPADAVILPATCWQYKAAFTCTDSASIDTCQPLRDQGCGQLSATCISTNDEGRCMSYTMNFQCQATPPRTQETNVCDTSLCAADGAGCFDTSHAPDRDFGKAAAMMETAREAGVYGTNNETVEIFKGFMEECAVKTIGGADIKSCCTAAGGGGAFNNYSVLGVTAEAAYAVGSEELKAGSKYVYDALFSVQDASLMADGVSAASGGLSSAAAQGTAAAAGTQFGAYGFEFSYSASGGFSYVGFDPYSFAFAVAMQIITQWLQCEPEEQTMQMKRGQNLCSYVGSYCASKVLGVCVEKKEKHCCFNSVLAKIINRQGRAQLGLSMEQCGGFDQAQLQALDFSAIDLSEFIASISPTSPNSSTTTANAAETVNEMISEYYENHNP